MGNPYATKGPSQFWRTAVADLAPEDVSPIPHKKFQIGEEDRIATAGSCFAQHVSRYIEAMPGVRFLQTEASPADQPVFSARYGNIYTVAQLRQLLLEATGQLSLPPLVLPRPDGRLVDAFRPTTYTEGFASLEDVAAARRAHLEAVRRVFTDCTVFVFTLGLIEGWTTPDGQFVLPIHPGVTTDDPQAAAALFHRYSYEEVKADLEEFLAGLRKINPGARVILTVSPVPLTATYTDEHVLSATVYSKSVLRAVCGSVESSVENAYYFPSYEIISSHFNDGKYYDSNKRTVPEIGVSHVMRVFRAAYFGQTSEPVAPPPKPATESSVLDQSYAGRIICDEEKYGTNIGF
ncbi:GSCFA domain-containing protein [Methylosinus sp. PW1]|uniref:GSCFA domain-containing protein n=1 Tax=Methylosinus sp. PW1 TaxID=107636 RepID=UPI00055BF264|nr:GSCFA domain-containing protein [Methylosinus sp. PW1]